MRERNSGKDLFVGVPVSTKKIDIARLTQQRTTPNCQRYCILFLTRSIKYPHPQCLAALETYGTVVRSSHDQKPLELLYGVAFILIHDLCMAAYE